jgi:hypothetical protein
LPNKLGALLVRDVVCSWDGMGITDHGIVLFVTSIKGVEYTTEKSQVVRDTNSLSVRLIWLSSRFLASRRV